VKVIRGALTLKTHNAYPVLAVGNFDGVHLGHQALLRQVVERARKEKGTAMAMTFDPHPVKVLFPDRPLSLLTSLQQKTRLIEDLGMDQLLCFPFTREFSEQKPTEFVENILHRAIRAREIYVGRNFAFGHGREGTAEDLKIIGESLGMKVSIIEPVLVNEIMVSSSRIRKLLLSGEVAPAGELLGRAYSLEGTVVGGDRRGRLLGFPTANLSPPQELIPKAGVYAVQVIIGTVQTPANPLAAVAYIGSRPTFGQGDPALEVHLFKYEGELYQQSICVFFLERIRDERVFSGPEELSRQIKKDVDRAYAIHEEITKKGRLRTRPTG
jgi:riboflavin kinase/FMN adenylyltransferase